MTYHAGRIADYLHRHEHATHAAANRAGHAIAAAWNDREFWHAATLDPLTQCANASPAMASPAQVLARLARHFSTHVHNVPAWAPPGTPATTPATPTGRQPERARLAPNTARELRRVLVTGSRTWTDHTVIRAALTTVWQPQVVLVTGGCPHGADHLCAQCWTHWGGQLEHHPADWTRYGRAAGFLRNQHMVSLGADLCLAFIHNHSPGATHCADTAHAAGIPTRRYHHHIEGGAA